MKKNLRFKVILLLVALSIFTTACSNSNQPETSKEEEVKNEYVVGQTWVISSIDPNEGLNSWSLVTHGIAEYVYMLQEDGSLDSRYIESIERKSDLVWEAKMKEDAKFSDGSPVDAQALSNCMNEIQEKNSFSNATAGVIKFEPIDDYKFEMITERPTYVADSILAEWTNVVYKDIGNGEFIFSGPYKIENLEADKEVVLSPNEFYPDADKRKNVIAKAFKDESSLKLAYESKELDMAFVLTPEVAEKLESEGKTIKQIDAGYQYFTMLNLENEIMKDIEFRQALDLGLNRNDYISALRGGRVANGLFAQYYPFAGNTELEYNIELANEKLDNLGWLVGDDGIREKDGKKLELKLVTYPTRPDLVIIMQIMNSQLKDLGISSKTELQDDIYKAGQSGDFDLLIHAQHTAPTSEPSFFLNQFFRTDASTNHSRYSSEEFDNVLTELGNEENLEKRYNLAIKAQEILHEDLPVLFLIDPQWHIGVSEELSNYQPYCGDYFTINNKLGL